MSHTRKTPPTRQNAWQWGFKRASSRIRTRDQKPHHQQKHQQHP
ncbi:MAG: hypothetical protein ACFNWU_09980 [Corynebacterium matruchotii]|nr:MAG TPA: Protein of unknown function (DUF3320) [Caudoviricetes sp.]